MGVRIPAPASCERAEKREASAGTVRDRPPCARNGGQRFFACTPLVSIIALCPMCLARSLTLPPIALRDSLCIVQDDPADLGQQILEMDKVYSNSMCNIAAADAATKDEGCFFSRNPELVRTFQVRLDADSSSEARHLLGLQETRPRVHWPLASSKNEHGSFRNVCLLQELFTVVLHKCTGSVENWKHLKLTHPAWKAADA